MKKTLLWLKCSKKIVPASTLNNRRINSQMRPGSNGHTIKFKQGAEETFSWERDINVENMLNAKHGQTQFKEPQRSRKKRKARKYYEILKREGWRREERTEARRKLNNENQNKSAQETLSFYSQFSPKQKFPPPPLLPLPGIALVRNMYWLAGSRFERIVVE